MKKKVVAVTGASGFIGRSVVPKLLAAGYHVIVVGRSTEKLFGSRVTYVQSDISRSFPESAAKKVWGIVHLAGAIDINTSLQEPWKRIEENLSMTASVLDAARNARAHPLVVFTSTDRVYGKTKKKRAGEDEPPFPIEPYTASKILCETLLASYAALYDIPHIILRLDSVYGPHQTPQMFISDIIRKMIAGTHITTGLLTVKKNFVYVDDVADAILCALKTSPKNYNQIYNIGGTSASLREVLREIQALIEKKYRKKITVTEDRTPRRPSKIEVTPFILTTGKARKRLAWRQKTPLRIGLLHTVDYFQSHHER